MNKAIRHMIDKEGRFLGTFAGLVSLAEDGSEIVTMPDMPADAVEVPAPPGHALDERWDGEKWVSDPPKWRTIEQAKAKLLAIDLASVRGLREYVAARADAPAILKTHEAEAVAERAKLV